MLAYSYRDTSRDKKGMIIVQSRGVVIWFSLSVKELEVRKHLKLNRQQQRNLKH